MNPQGATQQELGRSDRRARGHAPWAPGAILQVGSRRVPCGLPACLLRRWIGIWEVLGQRLFWPARLSWRSPACLHGIPGGGGGIAVARCYERQLRWRPIAGSRPVMFAFAIVERSRMSLRGPLANLARRGRPKKAKGSGRPAGG